MVTETSDMGEDEYIEVDKSTAIQSITIFNMLGDVPDSDEPIPLINVTRKIFEKVVTYLVEHENDVQIEDGEQNNDK